MHTAYIGMGANLPGAAGSPEATLAAAVVRMEDLGQVTAKSSLYSTEPVGFADQPRFVNAVVALETSMAPHQLLDELLAIERHFGRDRSVSASRTARAHSTSTLSSWATCGSAKRALKFPIPALPTAPLYFCR